MGVQVKRRTTAAGRLGDDAAMDTATDAPVGGFGNTPLARFLVGAAGTPPALADVHAALLSGTTLARMPEHPDHTTLRSDVQYVASRHLMTKVELIRLLRAWAGIGIEALVYKGFHLAEFVYASPGMRPYHDVDLLVREEDGAAACDAASRQGWSVPWRWDHPDHPTATRPADYRGHELAKLYHPPSGVTIDLHRRLAHNNHARLPFHRAQARLTERVWSSAERVDWAGVQVRIPRPADAAVVGIALERCWGADGWQVRARDYADLEALAKRHALDRAAIVRRAEELGVPRTVAAYLRRCDPFRRRLVLGAPSWAAVRWWNLRAIPERGSVDLERGAIGLADAIGTAQRFLAIWPLVSRARRVVQLGRPVADWTAAEPVRSVRPRPLGSRAWRDLCRVLRLHERRAPPKPDERQAVAALVAYRWLRARGACVELRVSESATDVRTVRLWLDGVQLDPTVPLAANDE
jgi:hypothetical protein